MVRLAGTFAALDPYDPEGLKTRLVGLEQVQIDSMLLDDEQDQRVTSNHKVRLARLSLAKEVVANPDVVFEDLKRPDQEHGLCWCGRPGRDWRGPEIERPAPPGMVFCVYATQSGKLVRWGWEPSDPENPSYPENWRNDRFGRVLWPPPAQEI